MTKCSVIGEHNTVTDKKPIKFLKVMNHLHKIRNSVREPGQYSNVELICTRYGTVQGVPFDLMFAYDNIRSDGCLYIGHWNDGVVS